jgi:hypothetical protein
MDKTKINLPLKDGNLHETERSSSPINRMSAKEFMESGYLQEANRNFFHPLGLALEIYICDETGEISLGGIWDYRDDPEGLIFKGCIPRVREADRIEAELKVKKAYRDKTLGFYVQPLEDMT